MKTHPKHQPIAVVGVAALFPGSIEKDGFWRDILAGRDLITDVPASHWLIDDYYDPDPRARDKTYCKRGAFLPRSTSIPSSGACRRRFFRRPTPTSSWRSSWRNRCWKMRAEDRSRICRATA